MMLEWNENCIKPLRECVLMNDVVDLELMHKWKSSTMHNVFWNCQLPLGLKSGRVIKISPISGNRTIHSVLVNFKAEPDPSLIRFRRLVQAAVQFGGVSSTLSLHWEGGRDHRRDHLVVVISSLGIIIWDEGGEAKEGGRRREGSRLHRVVSSLGIVIWDEGEEEKRGGEGKEETRGSLSLSHRRPGIGYHHLRRGGRRRCGRGVRERRRERWGGGDARAMPANGVRVFLGIYMRSRSGRVLFGFNPKNWNCSGFDFVTLFEPEPDPFRLQTGPGRFDSGQNGVKWFFTPLIDMQNKKQLDK